MRLRRADERGLTLIELLVTIAILGIIAVPLAVALAAYFRHTDETTDRLSLSHDAQISSAYFAQDVASMGHGEWTDTGFRSEPSLYVGDGSPVPCGSGPFVVLLLSDVPSAQRESDVQAIVYRVTVVNGEHQLHRQTCDRSGALTSDVVLAHNVYDIGYEGSCAAGCNPAQVRLELTLTKQSGNGTMTLGVTLLGERRQT